MNDITFVKKPVPSSSIKRDEKGKFTKSKFKKFLIKSALVLTVLSGVTGYGIYKIDKFFSEYDAQMPIVIQIRSIFIKQEPVTQTTVIHEASAEVTEQPKPRYADPVDQYIYEKFGLNGDLAVQVSRAENGRGDCDLIIIEPNDTVSVGRFMINSVHFKRFAPKDLVDCIGNVNAAFQIYTEQGGFQAWSVYNNGAYEKVDLNNYLSI